MQPKLQDALQVTQINKPITSFEDNMADGNQRNDTSTSYLLISCYFCRIEFLIVQHAYLLERFPVE